MSKFLSILKSNLINLECEITTKRVCPSGQQISDDVIYSFIYENTQLFFHTMLPSYYFFLYLKIIHRIFLFLQIKKKKSRQQKTYSFKS